MPSSRRAFISSNDKIYPERLCKNLTLSTNENAKLLTFGCRRLSLEYRKLKCSPTQRINPPFMKGKQTIGGTYHEAFQSASQLLIGWHKKEVPEQISGLCFPAVYIAFTYLYLNRAGYLGGIAPAISCQELLKTIN